MCIVGSYNHAEDKPHIRHSVNVTTYNITLDLLHDYHDKLIFYVVNYVTNMSRFVFIAREIRISDVILNTK